MVTLTLVLACRVPPEGTTFQDTGEDPYEGTTVITDGDTYDPGSGDDSGDSGDSGGGGGDDDPATCKEHLDAGNATTGVHSIATTQGSIDVWCDQGSDGGGWTLGFLKTSPESSSYAGFGAGWNNSADIARDPASASAASDAVVGWLDLNALDYDEVVVAAYAGGSASFRSAAIARSSLRIAWGDDGYLLYESSEGYTWCGGSGDFVDDGTGQVDQPSGAADDCKGHSVLGSGWDFSTDPSTANKGLTLGGGDGWGKMLAEPASTWVAYGEAGAAYAIWVR